MLTKSKVKEPVRNLPDQFYVDEHVERSGALERIESGKKASLGEKVLSEPDLEKEVEKWSR